MKTITLTDEQFHLLLEVVEYAIGAGMEDAELTEIKNKMDKQSDFDKLEA